MRLLLIGPMEGQLSTATQMAMRQGAEVVHAAHLGQAMQVLTGGKRIDLVMIDVVLDVRALFSALARERVHIDVVACGIDPDAKAAVAAIRAGAKEYVPLPPEPELIAAILAAVTRDDTAMLYGDPKTTELVRLCETFAPSDATILLTGESGVGKEVFAKHIHKTSKRADQPFVSVNCAAIPEQLLESELFGHEKGAFTGAANRRIGKFEEADGGTLLLDEISEMDVRLQAKLLRALQERQIDRVGGTKPISVDIRVLATSNRDLPLAVQAGEFREDLYYRLNVLNLMIPPLRERPCDIVVLATHFEEAFATANGLPVKGVSKAVAKALEAAPWPGNVRQLENTLHRAVLLSGRSAITVDDLQLDTGPQAQTDTDADEAGSQTLVGRSVADVEQELILSTLSHCLGNRTHASNILGISIRTLRNKLNQYSEQGAHVPPPIPLTAKSA